MVFTCRSCWAGDRDNTSEQQRNLPSTAWWSHCFSEQCLGCCWMWVWKCLQRRGRWKVFLGGLDLQNLEDGMKMERSTLVAARSALHPKHVNMHKFVSPDCGPDFARSYAIRIFSSNHMVSNRVKLAVKCPSMNNCKPFLTALSTDAFFAVHAIQVGSWEIGAVSAAAPPKKHFQIFQSALTGWHSSNIETLNMLHSVWFPVWLTKRVGFGESWTDLRPSKKQLPRPIFWHMILSLLNLWIRSWKQSFEQLHAVPRSVTSTDQSINGKPECTIGTIITNAPSEAFEPQMYHVRKHKKCKLKPHNVTVQTRTLWRILQS